VLAEEGAVHLELFSHGLDVTLLHFVQLEGVSVDDISSDILFQEVDDFQSLLVVLDGSNKELVAVALVVLEGRDLSVDFVLSKFVPGDVVLGGDEFLLESDSVLLRCDEELLVQVLDFCEFRDGCCSDEFISFVLFVSGELGIKIGLFKVFKEIKNCVNSVTCLCSSLQ